METPPLQAVKGNSVSLAISYPNWLVASGGGAEHDAAPNLPLAVRLFGWTYTSLRFRQHAKLSRGPRTTVSIRRVSTAAAASSTNVRTTAAVLLGAAPYS